ncbi:MAG: ATP phosphoribosyltransferase regulatory subunit [Hydrotalea sp.]|nr:ATP phosphoribosyltransferase regulatory subunit [Hydrotalea sp.]
MTSPASPTSRPAGLPDALPNVLPNVLPEGIDDRLPPVAFARQKVMSDLLQFFYHHGYDFIDPPLVEYANQMAGHGFQNNLSSGFISFDPLSGQPLVIRADMTTGVARIAADKLSDRARPLKLCYGGDVLRPAAINGKRQLTQVGVEIIGGGEAQNAEVLNVLFAALDNIIARPLWCDLALPAATRLIMQAITTQEKQLVENYVRHKDTAALQVMKKTAKTDTAAIDLLVELMTMTGLAVDVLPQLKELLKKHGGEKALATPLNNFIGLVATMVDGVATLRQPAKLTIDLTELLGFDYKTGFAFTLFDQQNNATVGRGGHYMAGAEEAVGFSLYLDNLLPMIKPTILSPERK